MSSRKTRFRKAPTVLSSPLSRRTVLRGLGAAMALPFLEAMWPRNGYAQEVAAPRTRMLAFYVPNGMHMPSWTPTTSGRDFEMTPILAPLEPFRDQLTVISGLNNLPARPDGPGDHAGGTGAFLTATHLNKSETVLGNSQSIDQLIASQVGLGHRFPSLVLGAEGGGNAGGCDSGYSCAYSRNISWIDETTPAAKETNPRSVFNRLFGSTDGQLTAERKRKQKLYRSSILDFVKEDTIRLQRRLGAADVVKLDEYLAGVRELERQIDLAEQQSCVSGERPERPEDFRDTVTQMLDLIALAFQCDISPVVTFMLGNGASNRPFPFLGISDGHHQISHHQDNPVNHQMLETIDIWEMEQLAYLLGKMSSVSEGDGTLLDNTLVFCSSEIEDGNSHSHENLPVLLAGSANGQLTGGRHLAVGSESPSIADLFTTIGHLCGAQLDRFGDDGVGALTLDG